MITAIIIAYLALSACVSVALIAACALSGRTHELSLCESSEAVPALAELQLIELQRVELQITAPQMAEVQRPKLQLQTSLSAQ